MRRLTLRAYKPLYAINRPVTLTDELGGSLNLLPYSREKNRETLASQAINYQMQKEINSVGVSFKEPYGEGFTETLG